MAIHKPLVLGMGGVGTLVCTLLHESGMQVTAMDRQKPRESLESLEYVSFIEGSATDKAALERAMEGCDAVISCLPYHLTLSVAEVAHARGVHYFDPTEDVATTNAIQALAKTSRAVMIPQNGLAPGFIGILGSHIARQFDADDRLRYIRMRVGALPQHPIGSLGYAGNWSLEGLIHEYIAECDIIMDGKRQKIPALRLEETLRIHGIEYQAFTTSGGLGTMTETFEGRVEELNYKSIRYPGHLAGMRMLIEELRFKDDADTLVKFVANALPPDDQDRVLVHASVQGKIGGKLQTKEVVADYLPLVISGKTRTAIAWTTAASIVAVVEMVSDGTLPQQGFVKQEDIPLAAFLRTRTGGLYAKNHAILQGVV